jgi:hypothetical protein
MFPPAAGPPHSARHGVWNPIRKPEKTVSPDEPSSSLIDEREKRTKLIEEGLGPECSWELQTLILGEF